MDTARIGRVLVASLHQAIADELPMRLEFYEHWLTPGGLRVGTLGRAPITAVLGFLRAEGEPYDRVMARAGEYAGEWTVADLGGFERRLMRGLPPALRVRAGLRVGRSLVRDVYPPSRAATRCRRGTAVVDLRLSPFCDVREIGVPRCGFYAAAFGRILGGLGLEADARVALCRASGGDRCSLSVGVRGVRLEHDAPAAA